MPREAAAIPATASIFSMARNGEFRSRCGEHEDGAAVRVGAFGNPKNLMPTLTDRLPANATGRYYVDSTCIDCDQCRTMAPEFFSRHEDGYSFVHRQPETPEEIVKAEEVAAACATASIGNDGV
jgi:ferredoxin